MEAVISRVIEPVQIENSARISLVLAAYNEADVTAETVERLVRILEPYAMKEVIIVDDASTDQTLDLIRSAKRRYPFFKYISFEQNQGQQAAFEAGLKAAIGDIVILMDMDLQDPPELIPEMIRQWQCGRKIVATQRRSRTTSPLRHLLYWTYYHLLGFISRYPVIPQSGDFCLYDREAVQRLLAIDDHKKVFRLLRSTIGFDPFILSFDQPARFAGQSKFTLSKLLSLALNGLRISGGLRRLRNASLCVSILALVAGLYSQVWRDDGLLISWIFFGLIAAFGMVALASHVYLLRHRVQGKRACAPAVKAFHLGDGPI